MNGILTIAEKEVKAAFRDRVFLIIVSLFVLLSVVSVYIGANTRHAELQAYENIVLLLKSQGSTVYPDPPALFPLSILANIVTYVSILGAVVAIFLGYEAFSGERNNGTLKLIATRPVYRDQILTGKLLGGVFVLGLILGIILTFNLLLFALITGLSPSPGELARLLAFFLMALIYLLFFYCVTLFVSIKTNDSEFGFLLMMVIWIILTFVIPQLSETQKNFALSLNTATQTVTQVSTGTLVSLSIERLSPAVQFQNMGKDLLQVFSETALMSVFEILTRQAGALINIMLPGGVLLFLSYREIQKEGSV